MESLELEGRTLGERHKLYNQLVKEAIANSDVQSKSMKIDYEENDVNNLLRIDVACARREVEHVLEVLKCEDLLYVSRALRRCTWLVTERQYAHIINPEHLHEQLFPHMTAKASRKLLLHVRLHLRDEPRVEQFYNYFRERNLQNALKWLPHCSLPFIENIVLMYARDIRMPLLKRLCKKSCTILNILIKSLTSYRCCIIDALQTTTFLLNTNTEEYLKIIKSVDDNEVPTFGKHHTHVIMKKCPQMILDNFDRYACNIDLHTFAKSLKKENIKEFLRNHLTNQKLRTWLTYDRLECFIELMPDNYERFEFVKEKFIDKIDENICVINEQSDDCTTKTLCYLNTSTYINSERIKWYKFAPFDLAFTDLNTQISMESSPDERIATLEALLASARHNLHCIQTLLRFYRDEYINEPSKFKNQFISKLLSNTLIHKYDEITWSLFNNIFMSMEIYSETNNCSDIQSYIQAVIIYKVLHREEIPKTIEKKFDFSTLSYYQKSLTTDEKDLLFIYLHDLIKSKVCTKLVENETQFNESLIMLEKSMDLMKDWKKELTDFPWILDKIRDHIEFKKVNSWSTNLSSVYNKNKSWRRAMFEESLSLCATEMTCVNALKHDPSALARHGPEIETLRSADGVSLRRLLTRLRIYWPQSLAGEWARAFHARLAQPSEHRVFARNLCTLLPRRPLLELLHQFAPAQVHIDCSQPEIELSLQKHLAKSMHLARPHPPMDALFQYALGNSLHYVIPSLNTILYNMSQVQSCEFIAKLLDSPKYIQKYGFRWAFTKLEPIQQIQIFCDVGKRTGDIVTRAKLFKHSFLLLKNADPHSIETMWKSIESFIDSIHAEENRLVYSYLIKFHHLPPSIRNIYLIKSFKTLNSLPSKARCQKHVEYIIKESLYYLTNSIDGVFTAEHMFEHFIKEEYLKRKVPSDDYYHTEGIMEYIPKYLLCCEDQKNMNHRYEKILLPLMRNSFAMWDVTQENFHFIRYNFQRLLYNLISYYDHGYLIKNRSLVAKLFTNIQIEIENNLSVVENYLMVRSWKIITAFVNVIAKRNSQNVPLQRCYIECAPEFSGICIQFLKHDVDTFSLPIYKMFKEALTFVFDTLQFRWIQLVILLNMLMKSKYTPVYLTVLSMDLFARDKGDSALIDHIHVLISDFPSEEVKLHYHAVFDRPRRDF